MLCSHSRWILGTYWVLDLNFFTTFVGNPPEDHYLSATETSMDLPGSKEDIKKIIVYLPEELKDCDCVHKDDNENMIMVMYEKP